MKDQPDALPEPGLSSGRHIPVLDGVRGLAILLVMIYHFTVIEGIVPVDLIYTDITHSMRSGVDLFFVLSGYLITGILLDTKGSSGFLRNFFGRRVLRIMPLYYAVVFVSLIVLPNIPHPKANNFGRIEGDEWMYWTFLSNVSIATSNLWRHGILDITWSVAIEEQFYLVWPFLVMLLPKKWVLRVCAAIVILSPIIRTIALVEYKVYENAIYVLTPFRADALAAGAWIATYVRLNPKGPENLRRWAKPVFVVAAPCFILSLITSVRWEQPPISTVVKSGFGYTAAVFLYSALLVLVATAPKTSSLHKAFTTKPMMQLGKYSYAIYLVHNPVRAVIRDVVYGPTSERFPNVLIRFPQVFGSEIPAQLLFYIPAAIISFLLGWLSWHLYEKHFLKLKKYFVTPPKGKPPLKGTQEPAI
ncbi:MAG: acyltransferase family protein [Phycisphaerales bacterium JB058]